MALAADAMTPIAGVEICSTTINAVVLAEDGTVVVSEQTPIDNAVPLPAQLSPVIDGLRAKYPTLNRVGVALPGLVDQKTGRVTYSANMPQNVSADVVREIKASSGLDIHIENDANAAAYGEYKLGAGRGCLHMFYATLGEGVGGAFIFAGELWRGAAGYAGEFGFVPINSEGIKLEEVASAANIVRRTKERFYQDSTSSLNYLPNHTITLEAIINAANKNDDFAQLMLDRTGSYVGTAIASVINLLNIERIVVGGAIMRAKEVVLEAIVSRAKEITFGPSFASTTIKAGDLGDRAAAIGVAILASEAGD